MCGVSLSVLWALHMTYKEIIVGKVRGVLSRRWCPHPLLFHVWQAWICKYLENFPSICQLVFSYPSSRHLYFLIFTFPRWEIEGETVETVSDFIFGGSKITPDGDCSHEIKRHLLLGRKVMTNLERIQKQRHYFANKGPASQGYGFSSGHVWMWELDCEESWTLKNWCFWTVVLEKTLESPLDCREIQPVHPKGDQSWVFIGRTDAEAETPVLWPPHVKSWLIGKDSDAGRDWGQEEKGTTEDEMARWHHWLDGREFEWTPGVGDGQGGLACCNSWGCKELDTTEQLNWTELRWPKPTIHPFSTFFIIHYWTNSFFCLRH